MVSGPCAGALKVLVADDQQGNRDWLMKLLTLIGFEVRGADNGAAAIQVWEEWHPRLILMDVHMPVMDGLEATRRIKGDPRGKETVVVVLTASALGDDRLAAMGSGADDFLAKPCREDQLLKTLSAHLNIAYEYDERRATPRGRCRSRCVRDTQTVRRGSLGRGRQAALNGLPTALRYP